MKHRFLYFFFLMSIISVRLSGQPELQKVLPLSPDAAAIVKYGNIPVGYYSGVPSISIPIYDIKSTNLALPLRLNYHAGGNKVEDIASSVGLGWSLSSLPSISRSVNGIPDENTGGFFSTYYGETVKQISERLIFGSQAASSYQQAIHEGQTDTEADIFNFNLGEKSGKFFWSQQTNSFLVTPWCNIKIEYVDGLFKFIDEDGSIYWFTVKESSASAGASGSATSTTWRISKIYDANKTDSLVFHYSYENHLVNTLNPKYKLVWGNDCGASQSVSTVNNTSAYIISRIDFPNGYALFNKEVLQRQDLNGGYALKNIQVYNINNTLIKNFELSYSYRGSGAIENKRLLLDNIDETTVGTSEHHTHRFVYESQIDAPSRLSPAQDYWGFYNGATTNTDLIPTASLTLPGGPVIISGADRRVRPEYDQFAILTRIYYPTGGYSHFEYENNTAYDKGLPKHYNSYGALLQADELTPPSNNYSTTFTINNPPDYFLNGGLGGANVTIQVGGMACIGCSLLTLRGLDAANNNIKTTIGYNLNYHLPNGNYEMTANFGTQQPDDFKNFHYIINWRTIDSSSSLNDYVGGLRVKSIKSNDGYGNCIERSYQYTNALVSDTSSGDIFSAPFFVRYQDYTCVAGEARRYSYKILANPNITQVSHSGSFVGYHSIYEKVDSLGLMGFNEYRFTNARDIVSENSPFPPPISSENIRGQPLQQNVFQKRENAYLPVKKISFQYETRYRDDLPSFCLKTREIHDPIYNAGIINSPVQFHIIAYELFPNWSAVSKKIEKDYDANDTTNYMETVTEFNYSKVNFQLVQTDKFLSNSKAKKTYLYYPGDKDPDNNATILGTPQMWDPTNVNYQHILDPVVKTKVYLDNTLITQETNTYNYDATNNLILKTRSEVLPSGVQSGKVGYSFSYDGHAQLQHVAQDGNVPKSILWGYNNHYVIANVNNATPNKLHHTSFEDAEGNSATGDSKTGEKSRINGYRKALTALDNGEYVLSYWQKSNNNWALHLTDITVNSGSFTINLTGQIDELRFYPKGAQMTTYTYEPLIGMTSITDANNRVTYYEYDGFNRLKNIRDNEHHIMKRYEYAYADNNVITTNNLNAIVDGYHQLEPGRMNSFFAPSGIVREQSIKDTRLTFRNGVAQLPEEYRIRDADFYSSFNLNLADPYYTAIGDRTNFCFMHDGYAVEWRLKMPENRFNKDVVFVNINFAFNAHFKIIRNGNSDGTYLYGYHDFDYHAYGFTNGGSDFDYIWVDNKDAFNNFQRIKLQVTSTKYRVYYNDSLVKEYPRTQTTIDNQFYVDANFLGNDGSVDYVKVLDSQGVVRYQEDFNDPAKPAKPLTSFICPAQANCHMAFSNYFNQTLGTTYTYSEIAALYLQKTGQSLAVCN